MAMFTVGFWCGKRHRQTESPRQPWDHRPASAPVQPSYTVVQGYACPEPVIGRSSFGQPLLPHPPPPLPESTNPNPVPRLPSSSRQRRPEVHAVGKFSDEQARRPENRFPEYIFWSQKRELFPHLRNCSSIKDSEVVESRRKCAHCELTRLFFAGATIVH